MNDKETAAAKDAERMRNFQRMFRATSCSHCGKVFQTTQPATRCPECVELLRRQFDESMPKRFQEPPFSKGGDAM